MLLAACMAGVHTLSKDQLQSFRGLAKDVEVPKESETMYPFEGPGPYATWVWRPECQGLRWKLTLTLPVNGTMHGADGSLHTQLPVIFFFNGFMVSGLW